MALQLGRFTNLRNEFRKTKKEEVYKLERKK